MIDISAAAAAAGTISFGGLSVNRLGLGTNRITDVPEARHLLQRAVELGVNFIDTAHRYGSGASEITIGKTLSPYRQGLVVTTKGGFDYGGETGSPAALRKELEQSLQRLQTDCIDLYQLHRVDPNVPIEESVTALKAFQTEGKIRLIGLSEVSVEQLQRAQQVATIVSVQNEYNVIMRKHDALVDYCTEQGIVFIPWYPLGGLDGGVEKMAKLLAEMAAKYSASAQQIALAWLLKRSAMILPIPGTLSIEHLEANMESAKLVLSDSDYDALTVSN